MRGITEWLAMVALGVTLGMGGVAVQVLAASSAAEANSPPTLPPGTQGEGTRRMAAELALFADNADLDGNPFLNAERVQLFSSREPPSDPVKRLHWDLRIALELLNAGRTAEAVAGFEEIWARLGAFADGPGSRTGTEVQELLAIAYLRLGEQENCIERHRAESCLLPISADAVHDKPAGSRAAIRELEELLSRNPESLRARWLLNVAYMTVGAWPDGVPAPWLIPPEAFASEHEIGRFPDVAAAAGLAVVGRAGGAIMDDFDGDDYLDLLVTSWGLRDQLRLFRNERDGTFTERTEEAGLIGIVSGLNAVHADYDNDGDLDVFVPRGAWLRQHGQMPQSLLRNRGDASFDDVTEEAGLVARHPSQAAAWGDYDNDGWVDLFVATETAQDGPRHPTQLFHNNGDGTFTDVARAVGVAALGYFKGAVWGDLDNDGRPELYVTGLHGSPGNMLFHNDGPDDQGGWRFSDATARAGVSEPAYAFPTWFFDYDNDGWLDLFVSGYAATVDDVAAGYLGREMEWDSRIPRLYRNRGDGTFSDVTRETRVDRVLLTMGCNFGDLDNDGWLDFYAGTGNPDLRTLVPNRMFRNAEGRFFQDVTTSGGFGHLQKGHGVAFGDLDNDGDQDVFLKVGGAFQSDTFPSALFANPGHGNRWITLKLVGVRSNRSAIGARIRVTIDEPRGPRDVHVTVTSGSSFGGSSLRQEIGLGRAERIRRIEIFWPASGTRDVLGELALDRAYVVREGSGRPVPLTLRRLPLSPR
jgi:hypothetical protein